MRKILTCGAALGLCLLTACGGSDDADVPAPAVTAEVSPGAVTDPVVATYYTSTLADTPTAQADTLEPVTVPEQLATDDTAEPTS